MRILDVGAGGRYFPFSLWEPFIPLAARIELVGVDVANLEPTAKRAAELVPSGSARVWRRVRRSTTSAVTRFDTVVSTQVLEHLPDWRGGLAQMTEVLKPCGEPLHHLRLRRLLRARRFTRAKLEGKRLYAHATRRAPRLRVGAG